MSDTASPLGLLVAKLATRNTLSEADADAILALPFTSRRYNVHSYLVREGDVPKPHCSFVVSGFAVRHKLTATGARQIVSLHMAGDILDLQHLFLNYADHNVQALNQLVTADIRRDELQALVLDRPAVAKAMWIDALVDASIYREWVTNVGRRDARSRIAHLLCEFVTRQRALGLSDDAQYQLPMTQEQIGDATSLTSVHVNRTLKSLSADGIIHYGKRHLTVVDWEALRSVAGFSALYLHLDQSSQLESV